MKTTIRSAVLTLALTVGAAAAAQAQTATPAQPGEHGRREMDGGARGEGRGDHGALKGITLSDAQKAQLKAVHEKYKAQHEAERARMKPVMDEVRAARQRGDTAAARAAWTKAEGARTQGQGVRQQEMAEVRAVLTADQQRQFDANVATMQARGREMRTGKGGHGRAGRGA